MPAINPTKGDVHVSTPLTNFAQRYMVGEADFVATRAMPMLPVSKQADKYWVFDKETWLRRQAKKRAAGTEAAVGGFNLSTDTYFAEERAFAHDLDDQTVANADSVIQLNESATRHVMFQLMLEREIDFATLFLNSSSWTGGTLNVNWSDSASTPFANFKTGKRTVQQKTGRKPNKLLIGRQSYDTLTENDEIISRISGGATTNMPAMVMRQKLAELLELDAIYVMDAIYNSANEGATASYSFVGGDTALLYYAPDTAAIYEPTAGVVFNWNAPYGSTAEGMRIKRYREEKISSDRIEGQMAYDMKVTGADLGYTFTTTSS